MLNNNSFEAYDLRKHGDIMEENAFSPVMYCICIFLVPFFLVPIGMLIGLFVTDAASEMGFIVIVPVVFIFVFMAIPTFIFIAIIKTAITGKKFKRNIFNIRAGGGMVTTGVIDKVSNANMTVEVSEQRWTTIYYTFTDQNGNVRKGKGQIPHGKIYERSFSQTFNQNHWSNLNNNSNSNNINNNNFNNNNSNSNRNNQKDDFWNSDIYNNNNNNNNNINSWNNRNNNQNNQTGNSGQDFGFNPTAQQSDPYPQSMYTQSVPVVGLSVTVVFNRESSFILNYERLNR